MILDQNGEPLLNELLEEPGLQYCFTIEGLEGVEQLQFQIISTDGGSFLIDNPTLHSTCTQGVQVANVRSTQDYYPFGMVMPGRSYQGAEGYRYGFIGAENDNEIAGQGNSQDHTFRSYDTRLGRYKSLDPLARDYPWNSPYAYAENRVVDGIDLEGLEYVHYFVFLNADHSLVKKVKVQDLRNMTEAQIRATHGMNSVEFYEKYSQSFGSKGRGVQYSYFIDPGDGRYYEAGSIFFDKDKGLGYHGIYYGPGCPTECGPIKEHERGINDYDYSLDPIDQVDALARAHDQAYDFEGYGEDEGILPSWFADYNTLEADYAFVAGLKEYLEAVEQGGYVDPYTGRAPSEEAIRKAEQAVFNFEEIIIPYKEGRKASAESSGGKN